FFSNAIRRVIASTPELSVSVGNNNVIVNSCGFNESKSYGFLELTSTALVRACAAQLDGIEYHGHQLKLRYAPGSSQPGRLTLFVFLFWFATDECLQCLWQASPILSRSGGTQRNTKTSHGTVICW